MVTLSITGSIFKLSGLNTFEFSTSKYTIVTNTILNYGEPIESGLRSKGSEECWHKRSAFSVQQNSMGIANRFFFWWDLCYNLRTVSNVDRNRYYDVLFNSPQEPKLLVNDCTTSFTFVSSSLVSCPSLSIDARRSLSLFFRCDRKSASHWRIFATGTLSK